MMLAPLVLALLPQEAYAPIRIADGVYSLVARDRGRGNTGCVVFDDFVLAIDAGLASDAIAQIRKLSDKPIRFLFESSSSDDHCAQSQVYRAAGATVVAQERLGDRGAALRFQTRLDLDDGGQRVELICFGAGNGEGDAVAYLPHAKTLFAGDLCAIDVMTSSTDTDGWLSVLDRLRELDIDHVIPGRGAPGGKELLDHQRRWLTELRAQLAAQLPNIGRGHLDLVQLDMPWFREWTGADPKQQRADLASVWQALTGRTPPWHMLRELDLVAGQRRATSWTRPRWWCRTSRCCSSCSSSSRAPNRALAAARQQRGGGGPPVP
ncbi:MAG: hypothetical protein U1E76_23590 [Planctomycetota bacterium]